jgi:hypothetical protein
MYDPTDQKLKALLTRQWQAPAASADARAQLLQAARTHAPGARSQWRRWTLPGAAAAAAIAALWLVTPRPVPVPVAAPQSRLNDEAVLAYVFATYDLEETS